jgi:O-antigen ligase
MILESKYSSIAIAIPFALVVAYSFLPIAAFIGLGVIALSFLFSALRIEKYLFYALALSLPLSAEIEIVSDSKLSLPSEAIVVFIALSVFFSWLFRAKPILKKPTLLDTVLILLVAVAFASVFFSSMPLVSAKTSVLLAAYTFVFYLQPRVLESTELIKLILLFMVSWIGVTLFSFWNFYTYSFNFQTIRGIARPFVSDHTLMSAIWSFVICYALYFFFKNKGIKKAIALCFVVIGFMSLFVSLSRAAWLGIGFAAFIGFAMFLIKSCFAWRKLLFSLWLLGGIVLAGIGGLFVWNSNADSGHKNATLSTKLSSVANTATDVSNKERVVRWKAAWRMFLEKPFTGHGAGTFQYNYIPYQRSSELTRISVLNPYHAPENSGGTAHSEMLLLLSEKGVFAGILFILFWFLVIRNGLKQVYALKLQTDIRFWAFMALLTYFVHGWVNNFNTVDTFSFLFFISVLLLNQKQENYE